ncbi:MAG: MaoC family dehydratase [Geminicoccaceae bacterium]|nr:MaoC family dehydratase [Geminicoccaceae bacterium]
MDKSSKGNFFEDLEVGRVLHHAGPRTVTAADAGLYLALTGSRYALYAAEPLARAWGFPTTPLEELLVFHLVFGQSVPDLSVNAVANLGYADGRFLAPVFAGETLVARSTVIGRKETSSRRTGIVWVRTEAFKADGTPVLSYVRWVLVNKRDPASPTPEPVVPTLPPVVEPERLVVPSGFAPRAVDPAETGGPWFFEDYVVGERIDHVDGMGVMESEHRLATRLYRNTARVHFNDHVERQGRLGAVIVYGGVVISIARALAFNGLGNVCPILAINGGTHVNPCRAGDTIYAWSEVLDKAEIHDRPDTGALRLRLVALKNRSAEGFPYKDASGAYLPEVLLDFDYWALVPRRAVAAGVASRA